MTKLESLKMLKIEALVAAMKYATRVDFDSHCQKLIDSVRSELNKVLRAEQKDGTVEARVDSDGDIVFTFEHGSFHFRLECRPSISLGQFEDLYEHSLAFTILKSFYSQVIEVLGLRDIDVFAIDFKNVFNLASPEQKNYQVLQQVLMPGMRNALSPLIGENSTIGRVDFKIGWAYDERRTCYFSTECPGNDNNTTFWPSLNIRTRDDIEVIIDESLIGRDIDKAYEVYCGQYTDVLRSLLLDVDLDFTRRLLERQ